MLPISRRQVLKSASAGFGLVALAGLLAERPTKAAEKTLPNPLAPKKPNFPAKAKRLVFIHMNGAMSQHDTFQYKPQLHKDDGQPAPGGGVLAGSKFKFKKYGDTGSWFSELLPNLAGHADKICWLRGLHTDTPPIHKRWCSCTPAAPTPLSPARAWGRGCSTAWGATTRICPATSRSTRRPISVGR